MKPLGLGILGSGKGSNCRAILESIRSGALPAEARVVISDVLEAWKQALNAGETITGCTVHYLDDKIDHGDIIAQRVVPILPNDSAESLHARIQVAEHELYPAVIAKLCRENDRRP